MEKYKKFMEGGEEEAKELDDDIPIEQMFMEDAID